MATTVRGIIFFGIYLFLVTLPLNAALISDSARLQQPFWQELAVGAGFIGYSLMAMEFALISRIKAAAQPFGEDALQIFHNTMGIVALGLILVHPILLIATGYPPNAWLNPFASNATIEMRLAALSLYALIALVVTSVWRKKLGIRYELWQLLHGLFALFILIGSLAHIFVIGRYTSTPTMRAVWLVYAILVSVFLLYYKILTPLLRWNKTWEVVENREEHGEARTLILKPNNHKGFSFQPGQFAWIKHGRTPFGMGQHPISISSQGDVDPGGTIAFTIKQLGDWSGDQVPALKPGDQMWVDGPHGIFSMDREQAMGYVFIGGGIGITPLYSMCQTMVEREDVRPVVLFYGATNWESATFRDELKALEEKMNLKVVFVLSHPEDDWSGETGYVSPEIMQRYLPKQYRRFKFLICGPEPLMDAMEEAIPALGVPPENVLTERFDMV